MCVKLKVNISTSMGVSTISNLKESMKSEYIQSEDMIRYKSSVKKTEELIMHHKYLNSCMKHGPKTRKKKII